MKPFLEGVKTEQNHFLCRSRVDTFAQFLLGLILIDGELFQFQWELHVLSVFKDQAYSSSQMGIIIWI